MRFRWIGLTAAAACCLAPLVFLSCSNNDSPPPTNNSTQTQQVDPAADRPGFYADMTEQTGIKFTYRNGEDKGHFDILGSLGGGAALIDYDQDGWLDIFLPGGGDFVTNQEIIGYPNRLFRNEGKWQFRDVTAEAGLPADQGPFYSHGAAVGDYNNDGWPDLLVTGFGRCALYRNNKGKFEEVTEGAKLPAKPNHFNPKTKAGHWSTSAAWCDFNKDGHPDLYLEHYVNWSFANNPPCHDHSGTVRDVCSPKKFHGIPDQLFFNNGDGTFRDVSSALVPEWTLKPGRDPDLWADDNLGKNDKGLGVLVVDVNDDGWADIYVANDTTDNYLYLNQQNGKFMEVGVGAGAARGDGSTPNGSMGNDAADYNRTGRFSIFVTNYQHEVHTLYRNQGLSDAGDLTFYMASDIAGIKAIGTIYVAFGTGFTDFDLDGNEDIFITNGHVVRVPPPPGTLKQRPVLLRNTRKPDQSPNLVRFANATNDGGPFFRKQHMGRGAAFGDLDNDGRTDIVVSHSNEPVAILRNDVKNDHHWLGVELIGKPNRDAVGAKLTLEVGNEKLTRTIKGGGSYLSAHDLRVIFGLGKEQKVTRLTVRWPSGKTQTWENLAVDRYWRLVEGEANAKEWKAGERGTLVPR